MKIFVINPGSTSTKIALFIDEKPVWVAGAHHTADDLSEFHHVNEQYEYRKNFILRLLAEADIPLDFDAVIARGGLLKPTPGGVYVINEQMKHDLLNARMEHACNLGALIADEIARECHCPAYIADPEVVDELQPVARLTGIPEIERISIFHALNSKAVSRKYAVSIGKHYEDLNLIVVHLGGGISVGALMLSKARLMSLASCPLPFALFPFTSQSVFGMLCLQLNCDTVPLIVTRPIMGTIPSFSLLPFT